MSSHAPGVSVAPVADRGAWPTAGVTRDRPRCRIRADLAADQEDIMGTPRRINVASGRPLERLAHYSRAVRAGDTVLQSGTTAIDRQGNVRGVGDAVRQVETIMTIVEWSMGRAGGRL